MPPARSSWLRSLAIVPGVVAALLPSATCPACIAAYTGVLSALGLGFLHDERVLRPLIVVFLAVGIASIAWSTRGHRRPGPLVLTLVGSGVVASARLIWSNPPLLYAGIAVLVAASLWNLWLRRPSAQCLIIRRRHPSGADTSQLLLQVPEMYCGGCLAQIRRALRLVPGLSEVRADLDGKQLVVRYQTAIVDCDQVREALARAGYASHAGPIAAVEG